MKKSLPLIIVILAVAGIAFAARPRVSPQPLSVEHNGAHAPFTYSNTKGAVLFYNVRAVEKDVLYRGSGFIRDRSFLAKATPPAFADRYLFAVLKLKKIRTIVSLEEPEYFEAEKKYFDFWNKAASNTSRYTINVVNFPIANGHAYDSSARGLAAAGQGDTGRFGLRVASQFIAFMKSHKPSDGAVYVHCDTGKDRTGVVVAAYELWRNQGGQLTADQLWAHVLNRYLVSNLLIGRDQRVTPFAGPKQACGSGEQPNFVCSNWLSDIRPQLETLAQLD